MTHNNDFIDSVLSGINLIDWKSNLVEPNFLSKETRKTKIAEELSKYMNEQIKLEITNEDPYFSHKTKVTIETTSVESLITELVHRYGLDKIMECMDSHIDEYNKTVDEDGEECGCEKEETVEEKLKRGVLFPVTLKEVDDFCYEKGVEGLKENELEQAKKRIRPVTKEDIKEYVYGKGKDDDMKLVDMEIPDAAKKLLEDAAKDSPEKFYYGPSTTDHYYSDYNMPYICNITESVYSGNVDSKNDNDDVGIVYGKCSSDNCIHLMTEERTHFCMYPKEDGFDTINIGDGIKITNTGLSSVELDDILIKDYLYSKSFNKYIIDTVLGVVVPIGRPFILNDIKYFLRTGFNGKYELHLWKPNTYISYMTDQEFLRSVINFDLQKDDNNDDESK